MTRINLLQTNFTSGELDPRLLGRNDLRSQENGAARLQNVFVETTGGVRRRSGMAYLATATGRGRLATFEPSSGGTYLFVFAELQLDIYEDGTLLATLITPWTEDDVKQISWAQFDDSVLVTHPDHLPQQVVKVSDINWTIADLEFSTKESGLTCQPFVKHAPDDVTLTASGVSGNVTLTTSDDAFVAEHLGAIFRVGGGQVQLTNIVSSTSAQGLVLGSDDLIDPTTPTINWDEQAFSDARGWPITITFRWRHFVGGDSGLSSFQAEPSGLSETERRHRSLPLADLSDDAAGTACCKE